VDLYRRYARLYLGLVYDALRFDLKVDRAFVVHRAIKPTWTPGPDESLFGPAFTCRGQRVLEPEQIDDTVRIRMFRGFTPGCVQVIDTGGDDTVAHFGDISGKLARRFGARGAVVDGYTRDARILHEDRFPIYCRGTQPTDAYGRWQIVEYGTPVTLPGPEGTVAVRPGDCIFGDPDGVIVIPRELAETVCGLAETRLAREDQVRRELVAADDVQELYDRIGRW
jgi:4-hydroxy-4-methyl-2-oxoglutarate aldolase